MWREHKKLRHHNHHALNKGNLCQCIVIFTQCLHHHPRGSINTNLRALVRKRDFARDIGRSNIARIQQLVVRKTLYFREIEQPESMRNQYVVWIKLRLVPATRASYHVLRSKPIHLAVCARVAIGISVLANYCTGVYADVLYQPQSPSARLW